MLRGLLSKDVDEFAVELALEFGRRFPPELSIKGARPSVLAKAVDDTCNRAAEFQRERRLGVYGKAKLGTAFKLQLRESDEMREDRDYLERVCRELVDRGLQARARLAMGDPATQLVKVAAEEGVDLIAMSTHGHRFLNDLIHGSTADRVRHNVTVPVLMVRATLTAR